MVNMETLVNYCKVNGFLFQGSEIYGGLANAWDYGPLGVELKKNIAAAWWKKFIQQSPYNVGIDSAILMNPAIWVASGHVGGFSDPLMECKDCHTRHRADHLIEDNSDQNPAGWSKEEMEAFILDNKIKCPNCQSTNFSEIKEFDLMFKTQQGIVSGAGNDIYLRPETAQGIFVNFKNIARTSRKKLPFGIGQIGKSFRNEITPGNFIFRTREFEQMELEFFCKPDEDEKWFLYWKEFCMQWLLNYGIKAENLSYRDHEQDELSHYSTGTVDIDYNFPFGKGELWGIAKRTDFDLKSHQEHSKQNLEYHDATTNEKYLPYVIEPSVGLNRSLLAFLSDAYSEDEERGVVLKLHNDLAPYKMCIMPLQKKLSAKALEVYELLAAEYMVEYDEAGNIGKRYKRQDAIGTPYCLTVDFDSLEDESITIRDRDTMEQSRVKITELLTYFKTKFNQ